MEMMQDKTCCHVVVYCPSIRLENLGRTENISQDNWSPGQDSKPNSRLHRRASTYTTNVF